MNNEEKILAMLEQLQEGQSTLNQRLAVLESKMLHELAIIREGVTGLNERNRQADRLEEKVDNHDHRIFALEQLAKAE